MEIRKFQCVIAVIELRSSVLCSNCSSRDVAVRDKTTVLSRLHLAPSINILEIFDALPHAVVSIIAFEKRSGCYEVLYSSIRQVHGGFL